MEITTLLLDSSWVMIFPKNKFVSGEINSRHDQLKDTPGYRFFDHFQLNQPLVDYLLSVNNRLSINMFTAGHVQNLPEVRAEFNKIFERVFSKAELGIDKTSPDAYLKIAQELGKKPEEILFIDDTQDNVRAAEAAGMKGLVFIGNDEVLNSLKKELQF